MITNTLFHYLLDISPLRMPWGFVRNADLGPTPQLLNHNSEKGVQGSMFYQISQVILMHTEV